MKQKIGGRARSLGRNLWAVVGRTGQRVPFDGEEQQAICCFESLRLDPPLSSSPSPLTFHVVVVAVVGRRFRPQRPRRPRSHSSCMEAAAAGNEHLRPKRVVGENDDQGQRQRRHMGEACLLLKTKPAPAEGGGGRRGGRAANMPQPDVHHCSTTLY